MKMSKHAFWSAFAGMVCAACACLGTFAALDAIYDKGYDKGVKVGIEKGKEQTMKDIELNYDMCVKKKGE